MHGMTVHVSLDEIFGTHSDNGYGLLLEDGPDSFVGVGRGFRVLFTPRDVAGPHAGIASVEEGHYIDGRWTPGRRLNGDENDQGAGWRFDPREAKIERALLYHFP